MNFDLIDLSKDEQDIFLKDFFAFLDAKGVYFEPVPQFERSGASWNIKIAVMLQKKVPKATEELTQDNESPKEA